MNAILKNKRRLGIWAGIIAPVIFVGIFMLEGLLRPGYSAMSQFVSELSLGSRGWIQIANFVITGILLFLFARTVASEFKDGRASKSGPILLYIMSLALFVSGPLVMDPANTPRDQWTWHGILHQIFGAIFFSLTAVTTFLYWLRFRQDKSWKSMATWTLIATLIILIAVVLLRLIPIPPAAPNQLTPWAGLIQRKAIVTFWAWVFTLALSLHRRLKI